MNKKARRTIINKPQFMDEKLGKRRTGKQEDLFAPKVI